MQLPIRVFLLIFLCLNCTAQSELISWSEEKAISLEDIEVRDYSKLNDTIQDYHLASSLEFNYELSNYTFAFTKSFNQYVKVVYSPEKTWVESGENITEIIQILNIEFDILELYARILRKELKENKNFLSSTEFSSKIVHEVKLAYESELEEFNKALANTRAEDLPDFLDANSKNIRVRILDLGEYCNECKPDKKEKWQILKKKKS